MTNTSSVEIMSGTQLLSSLATSRLYLSSHVFVTHRLPPALWALARWRWGPGLGGLAVSTEKFKEGLGVELREQGTPGTGRAQGRTCTPAGRVGHTDTKGHV